jgi:class 3 adenylate cyclase/tetratricopeptide (TPR) repeat protein/ABC-type transport system involved in cytochrome c biogenesis ATPase subunit
MRFCGGCGAPLQRDTRGLRRPRDGDGAQRRHMTVMFCDMVGSTPLAELLDPEDFHELLGDYQAACARAIERFGGYLAKYVGDGVVAYFGYPRAHEDDAQRALHAGLGILDELTGLNSTIDDPRISVHVRIGLHSGTVVAGEMGAGEMPAQREIVGEMPHIAARLESIAPTDSVVISDATRNLVEGYFETESLGEKDLKGISRPIAVHRVLRPTGAVGRLAGRAGRPLTPVVGRDRELASLMRAWERAEQGEGTMVHVRGEAGIGKSRLLHALGVRLGQRAAGLQTWQCSAHHAGTSLYPVIRYLEHVLELDRSQSTAVQLERLRRVAEEAGVDPEEALPLLADLLSIDGDELTSDLSPRDARTATLRALQSLLVADPARHPLLLVVEDLHWADPTTLELIERILSALSELPTLCVATSRGDFEPSWSQQRNVTTLELGPLSSQEVRTMVAAASESAPDPALLRWVDSAAEGVPLFVEEMLKMMKLGGAPTHGADPPSVPPTLEGLLTERLDRLPDLGDVIDAAAVIGREFDRGLLEALDPLGGAQLEPAIALLVAQGILRPVPGSATRLEFTHALLQEAAYERLLRRRRHVLHARVADVLSRDFADVTEREPEIVARHWTSAAEPAKATAYWHAAGRRALERAAFQEAAEHFRRGLEALEDAQPGDEAERVRADLLTHRAASLQAAYGYGFSGVDESYLRARSAYAQAGADDRLDAVIRGEWMFHLLRGQYPAALELAREMLERGARHGDPVRLAEGHLYGGLVHTYLGDFVHARQLLDEAFDLYRRPERPDQVYDAQGDTGVGALAYNAVVLWNLGYHEESSRRSDQSLELAEQVGGQVTRAQAWGMRSMLHMTRAEPPEVARWVEMSRAHSVEHNVGYWRILSTLFSGWLLGRAGDLRAGIKQLEESLDEYLDSGSRLGLPLFLILQADLRLAAGDHQGALGALDAGEAFVEEAGERFSESELHRFKARALMAAPSPDVAAATEAYHKAVASARRQEARLLWLRAAMYLHLHERRYAGAPTGTAELAALCEWFGTNSRLPDVLRARELLTAESVRG